MFSVIEPPKPMLDRAELLARLMGSVDLTDRLLRRIGGSCTAECDLMETSARHGDTETLVSLARHLGETSENPGETTPTATVFAKVSELSETLQQPAVSGSVTEWLSAIDQLRQVQTELQLHRSRGPR